MTAYKNTSKNNDAEHTKQAKRCKAAYDRERNRAKGGSHLSGELDPASTVGKGFISEMVVAKALGLENSARCNCTVNFSFKYDLHDINQHGEINVKSAKLGVNNSWIFSLLNKYTPDTYIFVAYSENRKNIEHVWVIPTHETIVYGKKGLHISNSAISLGRVQEFEVNTTMYNFWLHTMSIDNCSVLKNTDVIPSATMEMLI